MRETVPRLAEPAWTESWCSRTATSAAHPTPTTTAAPDPRQPTPTSRLASFKNALSGLVSNGTLTQAQADKVAGTLESQLPMGGMGGRGGIGGPDGRVAGIGMTQTHEAAAKALRMTVDELYTAVQGGKSLAEVAGDQIVSVDSLIKAMVAAAQVQLDAAVKDGTLTQAQADSMKSALTQRITDQANGVRLGRGTGRASRGASWSALAPCTLSTPFSTT